MADNFQTVSNNPPFGGDVQSSDTSFSSLIWLHPLIIPVYVAAVSTLHLAFRGFLPFHFCKAPNNGIQEGTTNDTSSTFEVEDASVSSFSVHVDKIGGPTVLSFNLVRVGLVLALFILSATSIALDKPVRGSAHSVHMLGVPTVRQYIDLAQCLIYMYLLALAVSTLVIKASATRVIKVHATAILLVNFVVYAYRDVWPLLTSTLAPKDEPYDRLLWIKVAVLAATSLLLPLVEPRPYIAYNPKEPALDPNPEQTASFLSLATYSFLDRLVIKAYRLTHLPHDELLPLADYDRTKNLVQQGFRHLDTCSGARGTHIFWGLMKTFASEWVEMTVILVLAVFTSFLQPLAINQILKQLESHGQNILVQPWTWVVVLFLGPFLNSVTMQRYMFLTHRVLVRSEAIITELIFEHSLRIRMIAETHSKLNSGAVPEVLPSDESVARVSLSQTQTVIAEDSNDDKEGASKAENLVGKINNLVSTDMRKVGEGRDFLLLVVQLPLQVAICIWFLYALMGWSAFVGVAFMTLLLPIPGKITSVLYGFQEKAMEKTDARVQTVTETMGILRMIKLFGWEEMINSRLNARREEEMKFVEKRKILRNLTGVLSYVISVGQMLASFATYTLVAKQKMTPSVVFTAIELFFILQEQMHNVFNSLSPMIQTKVSLDRITKFLHETELLDEYTTSELTDVLSVVSCPDGDVIGFKDASFTWSDHGDLAGSSTPSSKPFNLHIDGEVLFKRGSINLILGPTGSGKTSVLMALLGEMHYIPISPSSWVNLPRAGGIAYAAQESWVQNETIMDNILFGAPYDEERYKKVIYQCGLERDLSLFAAGDKTEVGENGLTLSGGQRARVTLARAIYSSADILLLDDVLAALDVHTATWIVEKCFNGDLIQDRTVLLITHNVLLAKPIADYVVSLGIDGRIVSHGSLSNALSKNVALSREIETIQDQETGKEVVVDEKDEDEVVKQSEGKLILEEDVAEGHVTWSAMMLFWRSLGGPFFWLIFVAGLLVSNILGTLQSWFLGYWAEQYDRRSASEVNAPTYLGLYGLLILGFVIVYTTAYTVYVFGTVRAAKVIHAKLVQSILGTTLRWLDATPTSRVVARCTQDMNAVDDDVSAYFSFTVELSVKILVKLVAICIITPAFIGPTVVTVLLGVWCGRVYMAAELSVKREMSVAKAPVLGHFGAAIAGLTSIRAYGAQASFREKSYQLIDRYTKAARTFYNLNRWVSVRIDTLGGLYAAALAAYMLYGTGSDDVIPSNTGFSLVQATSFCVTLLWIVQFINELEIHGNSLERIEAYLAIEQEPKPTKDGVPPAYWPASGDLRVENLSARYSPEGPEVLHGLSFHIKAGERIGIVGRTGSGKSSLTLSLLRFIFTEGTVYYDEIPTNSINLNALRSNITLIPQSPQLMSGTLRENLDPLSQYDDTTLNAALRSAGLFTVQNENDEARITLDFKISGGGSNLSVGQRQILALARAIVRGSKLLIHDEATSSIDHAMDSVIQTSLRKELGSDVTLVTIAHRLQTVMDADRIMVLDAGHIVEFAKPSELLEKEGGILRLLVDASVDKDRLYAMAAG